MKEFKGHPSYGMVSFHRTQSSKPVELFGANVKHSNTIVLRISQAEHARDLSNDWFHATNRIIEVELSPIQYAELLTNMNTQGVPCTILAKEGVGRIERPEYTSYMETIDNEFAEQLSKHTSDFKELSSKSKEILKDKKSLNKEDKATILEALSKIESLLSSTLPFVKEQFTEASDRTISEVKTAIDSHHLGRMLELGAEAYKNELLLEGKEGEDE